MPVSWRLVDRVVLLESDDPATFGEWSATVDAALNDPAFKPGMSVVHDVRRMTRVPAVIETEARVNFIAERCKRFKVRRWAAVVSDQAHLEMGRLAETLSDPAVVHLRVFEDLAEALTWAQAAS